MQQTTIRLTIILEVLLGLKTNQGYVTVSFINEDVEKGENIRIEMSKDFEQKGNLGKFKGLKLKNSLWSHTYSLRILEAT